MFADTASHSKGIFKATFIEVIKKQPTNAALFSAVF
jgi:hypothetical protein